MQTVTVTCMYHMGTEFLSSADVNCSTKLFLHQMRWRFCNSLFKRIYVVCCICRNLCAFWGDQTDPKSACGGPTSILRTGPPGVNRVNIIGWQVHIIIVLLSQCRSGHPVCSNCRPKVNKCPTCRQAIIGKWKFRSKSYNVYIWYIVYCYIIIIWLYHYILLIFGILIWSRR